MWRAARPPPYLYFMPVPRPVLSRRTPADAGGRGTTAARALGPDPPPPGGFPCPPPTGPPLPPPGPGRGPHRRSSLLRLRRFCSVHAIDTCMPAGQGEGGGSEGAGGGGNREARGETPGGVVARALESGKAEEVAAGAARQDPARGGGLLEVAGFAAERRNAGGRHEWSD